MSYGGKIVYKYVTKDRIDVLENRLIRFTSHRDLNDPFECQFALEPFEHEQVDAEKDGFRTEQAEVSVWLDDLNPLGILSLSETSDNLLMWAHYAQDHTGFVIGFDAQHEWFRQGRAYYKDPILGTAEHLGLDGLQRVDYSPNFPITGRPREIPHRAFVTKSSDWCYEREIRKFRHQSEASCVNGSVHLFEFPKCLVREVILGCQSTPDLAKKVQQVKRDSLPHIILKQAQMELRSYAIRIVALG